MPLEGHKVSGMCKDPNRTRIEKKKSTISQQLVFKQ